MVSEHATTQSSRGTLPKQHKDVYPAISSEALASSMNGRVVLVTGAGRGIGRAIAMSFARAGAKGLAILSRTASELESLASEIATTCPDTRTLVCVTDVTDSVSLSQAVQNVERELGSVDVLVANAGVNCFRPFAYTPMADWWRVMEINLKGPLLLAEMVLLAMREKNQGVIIFISSIAGVVSLPGASSYTVSKTALIRACTCLQLELDLEAGGKSGIHSYVLHPGGVKSDMTLGALHPDVEKMEKGFSDRIRRLYDTIMDQTPELCGQTCAYLAAGHASALRGRYIDVGDDIEDLVNQADIIHKENMYDLGMAMLGGERSDMSFSRRGW